MNGLPLKLVRDSMNTHDATAAFLEKAGWGGAQRGRLAGDASFRHYEWVEREDCRAVLMVAPPDKEPLAPFIAVDEYLVKRGFSAPELLVRDVDQGYLLLEDLGKDLFSRYLKEHPQEEGGLYSAAADVLAELHQPAEPPIELPEYGAETLLAEVALFADWYLPEIIGEAKASALRGEYLDLWRETLAALPFLPPVVVLRDYHADNLIWLPQRKDVAQVGLLDFQDAVMGSPAYDLVSLLEDARRDVPPEIAQITFNRYVQKMKWDQADFTVCYAALGAQRNTKIIGIFTRLAKRDGKPGYLAMIPRVWGHLQQDLNHPALKELQEWMDRMLPEDKRTVPVIEEKKLAG